MVCTGGVYGSDQTGTGQGCARCLVRSGPVDKVKGRAMEFSKEEQALMGGELPDRVNSIYFGGGTPSLLEPAVIAKVFGGLRNEFVVEADAEVTVSDEFDLPPVSIDSEPNTKTNEE